MQKVKMLNTYVNSISTEEALHEIDNWIDSKKKAYVVAVNVDVIIKIEKDPLLKQITDEADMVLVDGKPLIWISKLYKRPIKEKVSGSDLVPKLCKNASVRGRTIFILGGKEGVANRAKKNLEKQFPSIKIVGTYAPPFGFENDQKEIDKINTIISEAKPNILIACFGCPKQEKFIYHNLNNYDANVSICAGATVDFIAGEIERAPKWMSDHGLEWFYRFINEPKRLFKRYFIDDIKILRLIFKYK